MTKDPIITDFEYINAQGHKYLGKTNSGCILSYTINLYFLY
jgi:hypothetical protein